MPELPEIETIVRDLSKSITNAVITNIIFLDERVRINCSQKRLRTRLKDQQIKGIRRRGKAIILQFVPDRCFLVVQLMMTGQLIVKQKQEKNSHTKIIFGLSNQQYLHYNDQRLFGRLQIVDKIRDVSYLQMLGPEPLGIDFSISWLKGALSRRSLPIKVLLMNHQFLAGIGNIYASEILFDSLINPCRPANSLGFREIKRLHSSTIKVLTEAISFRGTSMNNYRDSRGEKGDFLKRIRVYGRENEHCCRCRTPLVKIVLSGRSTFFCENCQPLVI